jgi:Fur family transcriptional regulator, ferric uptake regulator
MYIIDNDYHEETPVMPGPYICRGYYGRFRKRGLRMTFPRQVILEYLADAENYQSAEEVYMNVHKQYPGIGLATVYRTLNLLADMGVVTKFEFGEGKARYELAERNADNKHHHLLVCSNCFSVIKHNDFSQEELDLFNNMEKSLNEKYDFAIQRHVVQFYGLCSRCKEEEQPQAK